jgi:thiamine-phosphate pyrophosphorylase
VLPGRLVLVTDRHAAAARGRDPVDLVAEALAALPRASAVVQVREKDLPARELLALVRRVIDVAREQRCPVLVNDRLDVALAAGADGVHLPEAGLPIGVARRLTRAPFLIGVSVHGADAAGAAARDGADLVQLGPVWDTPSKRGMGEPLGVAVVAAAARAVAAAGAARLYAVGGVTSAERAAAAVAAGAHGVAVIRAVWDAGDAGAAAAELERATAAAARR